MAPTFESKPAPRELSLDAWYTSPEKHLVENRVAQKIQQFPQGTVQNLLLNRVATGKRVRPFLLFALNQDRDNESIATVAATIELAHQASLIFDDTIDDHDIRDERRESLHKIFGGRVASAGIADHLGEYILSLHDQGIDELPFTDTQKNQIRANSIEMKQKMVIAQFADRFLLERPEGTTWAEWCLGTAYQKTSTLMAVPFDITGIIRDLPQEERQMLRGSGEALGRIYQLYDDMQDLRVGMKSGPAALTYPFAVLLDNAGDMSEAQQRLLQKLVGNRAVAPEDLDSLNALLSERTQLINAAAQSEVNKMASSISLPVGISGKKQIDQILRSANKGEYWNYEIPKSTT